MALPRHYRSMFQRAIVSWGSQATLSSRAGKPTPPSCASSRLPIGWWRLASRVGISCRGIFDWTCCLTGASTHYALLTANSTRTAPARRTSLRAGQTLLHHAQHQRHEVLNAGCPVVETILINRKYLALYADLPATVTSEVV